MFIERQIHTHLLVTFSFFFSLASAAVSAAHSLIGHGNLSSFLSRRMLFFTPKLIVLFYGEKMSDARYRLSEMEMEMEKKKLYFCSYVVGSTCNRRKYLFISVSVWTKCNMYFVVMVSGLTWLYARHAQCTCCHSILSKDVRKIFLAFGKYWKRTRIFIYLFYFQEKQTKEQTSDARNARQT